MKKYFYLLLAALFILPLTACSKPVAVPNDFSAAFTVKNGDADYAGDIQKKDDLLTVTMTAPYTVKGMTFCYRGAELSIGSAGHSTNANADYLPDRSVPSVLHNTLTYLGQAVCTASKNGTDSFSLPTPYGDAELNAENGVPVSLLDPHSGLEFCFSEKEQAKAR